MISALNETLGVRLMSPEALAMYVAALRDLSDEQFTAACSKASERLDRMPRPAELRKLAGVGFDPEAGALEALAQVHRAIGAYGRYRSVNFGDDPAINAALRSLGGWVAACELSEDEWTRFKAREFKQAYSAIRNAGCSEDTARYLPGLEERNWRSVDGPPPKPVLIEAPKSRLSLPAPRTVAEPARALPGGHPKGRASSRKAPARSLDSGKVRELTAGLAAKKSIGGGS